jgi:hypothetical protein
MTAREDSQDPSRADSCGSGSKRSRRHDGGRKERVLHTRVSEQLSDDIRQLAEDLRVPVSNLVRNVLEEVFAVVENVSDDVGEFFEEVVDEADGIRERVRTKQRATRSRERTARRSRRRGRNAGPEDVEDELAADERAESKERTSARAEASAPPSPPTHDEDVLGWQPIVLNRACDCAGCGHSLLRGQDALLAVTSNGQLGKVVCPGCGSTA